MEVSSTHRSAPRPLLQGSAGVLVVCQCLKTVLQSRRQFRANPFLALTLATRKPIPMGGVQGGMAAKFFLPD
jgi:hypothetical protein